jgi:uncharacterized protein YceH (UPF0502 family)
MTNVPQRKQSSQPGKNDLAARVEKLERSLAELKQEFADYQRGLHDAGIRLNQ